MWPRGATSSLALPVGSPALLYKTWQPSTCEEFFIQHLSALFRATRGWSLGPEPGVSPFRFLDTGRPGTGRPVT